MSEQSYKCPKCGATWSGAMTEHMVHPSRECEGKGVPVSEPVTTAKPLSQLDLKHLTEGEVWLVETIRLILHSRGPKTTKALLEILRSDFKEGWEARWSCAIQEPLQYIIWAAARGGAEQTWVP